MQNTGRRKYRISKYLSKQDAKKRDRFRRAKENIFAEASWNWGGGQADNQPNHHQSFAQYQKMAPQAPLNAGS
jgi:hypothetical protein